VQAVIALLEIGRELVEQFRIRRLKCPAGGKVLRILLSEVELVHRLDDADFHELQVLWSRSWTPIYLTDVRIGSRSQVRAERAGPHGLAFLHLLRIQPRSGGHELTSGIDAREQEGSQQHRRRDQP
jgi:hypothetical protein